MAKHAIDINYIHSSVLKNIKKCIRSKEVLDELLEYLPDTQLSEHIYLWQSVREMYTSTGEFPDLDYLKNNFPSSTYEVTDRTPEPTVATFKMLLARVKKEHLAFEAVGKITQTQSLEGVDELVNEFNNAIVEDVAELDPTKFGEIYQEDKESGDAIKTGVYEIDSEFGGINYGALTVIAGGAGHGKTQFARSIMYNALLQGKNVVFISLEITASHMNFQLAARHSLEMKEEGRLEEAISGGDIIAHRLGDLPLAAKERLPEEYKHRLEESVKYLNRIGKDLSENVFKKYDCALYMLYEKDFKPWTFDNVLAKLIQIDEKCKEEHSGKGIDLVILDYAQRMNFDSSKSGRMDIKENRNMFIDDFQRMSTCFEGRAIATVLLSQINREGMKRFTEDDKRKKDSTGKGASEVSIGFEHLADLNSIERDASLIIAISSTPEGRSMDKMSIQLVKTRNGTNTLPYMTPITAQYRFNRVGGKFVVSEEGVEAYKPKALSMGIDDVDDVIAATMEEDF